jgi:twitching motility protein PilT
MVANNSIAHLIRENKTFRIASDIQTGAKLGMVSLDAHLLRLYNADEITADEALIKSQDIHAMRDKLRQAGAVLTD